MQNRITNTVKNTSIGGEETISFKFAKAYSIFSFLLAMDAKVNPEGKYWAEGYDGRNQYLSFRSV